MSPVPMLFTRHQGRQRCRPWGPVSCLLALLISTAPVGAAGVIPGRWEKVDYLQSGTQVVVSLNTGERLECIFVSSDRDSLLVVEIHGDQRRIRKSLVETVTAEKYDDHLSNGAILGLLSGVGAAAALSAIPRGISRDDRVTYAVYGSVLFGLGGMSIGTLIDRSHKGRELLYEAPKKIPPDPCDCPQRPADKYLAT